MDRTPMLVVTRELAELEAEYNEIEAQQEERWDLIRRKRERLLGMGVALDD